MYPFQPSVTIELPEAMLAWINGISFWLFEIPLAYLFAITLGYGLEGACYAIICAESVLTIISLYIFRKGKWKLREV